MPAPERVSNNLCLSIDLSSTYKMSRKIEDCRIVQNPNVHLLTSTIDSFSASHKNLVLKIHEMMETEM